jgi:Ca-activated chloride channel family protein
MHRLPHTARLVVPACALALAAAACTAGTDPPARADIDPRSYVDDYESGADQDMAVSGVMPSATQEQEAAGAPPGLLEDNTFVDAGTSGFVATAQDARSTFALDVDTGSFSVGRTLLREGRRPPPASIRVEEWVNAVVGPGAAPTGTALGVGVTQGSRTDGDRQTRLVQVDVTAREVTDADRPPVAITLVVDTSGSMDIRERLGLVKASLALLAQTLRDDDTIAVVTYEDRAQALLEPTPVSETDTILEAIDDLRPGGSTNLEAGLRTGYREARAAMRPDALDVVVLASDGVANVGVTDGGELAETIARAGDDGIHLVTVGFGMGNYNDHLMEQLADQGDGFYAYVDTFEEAERLFVEDLTSTLTVVARDARVQVAFDETAVQSYRLVGYDNRAVADDDFADRDLDAGEVGAGHDVTALYELRLTPQAEPGDVLGEVALRWRTDEGAQQQSRTPVALTETEEPARLRLAFLVADLAELLKGSEPATARELTLEQLAKRAAELEAADVEGAAEVTRLVEQALAL